MSQGLLPQQTHLFRYSPRVGGKPAPAREVLRHQGDQLLVLLIVPGALDKTGPSTDG